MKEFNHNKKAATYLIKAIFGKNVKGVTIFNQHFTNDLNRALSTLAPREEAVLKLRVGLTTYENRAYTLKEVGDEFYVTKERARQIEVRALRKLRHPTRANLIKKYVEFIK